VDRDYRFWFATGLYYQPPFYRELRDPYGVLNPDIKAQRSIHFVLGMDRLFDIWDRPFKFTAEGYYKMLDDLIPYEVENVRIRYYAKNNAKGFATGVDLKLNGEFIPGVESWASLGVLSTFEDLNDDFYYIAQRRGRHDHARATPSTRWRWTASARARATSRAPPTSA
jgi:hypothetical protein